MTDANSGLSLAVEDFVPYSDERAVVTCGRHTRDLREIRDVRYEVKPGVVELSDSKVIATGEYLRLGHMSPIGLVYSDGWEGPHQPHWANGVCWCTDDAPNGRVYCNGELAIDHFDSFVEVCNPWVSGPWVYFEANRWHESPGTWQIWRMEIASGLKGFVTEGANPSVFGNILWFERWLGNGFGLCSVEIG